MLFETIIENLLVLADLRQAIMRNAYILNHQFTVEGLARPVSAKQTLSHSARATVTSDHIVSLESELAGYHPWLTRLHICPCFGVILPNVGDTVIESDINQPLAPLHAVLVHDLQNHVERQNCHAVFFVLNSPKVNAGQFLPRVLYIAPADVWKGGNAIVAEVLEQASASKNSSCRDAVLCGS